MDLEKLTKIVKDLDELKTFCQSTRSGFIRKTAAGPQNPTPYYVWEMSQTKFSDTKTIRFLEMSEFGELVEEFNSKLNDLYERRIKELEDEIRDLMTPQNVVINQPNSVTINQD